MTSDLCLYLAGIVLSFSLQIAVAYLACSLLTRLLSRPSQRFAVWMAFLGSSTGYWLALASWNARVFSGAGLVPGAESTNVSPITSPFLFPLAWSHRIQLASELMAASYLVIFAFLAMASLWRRLRLRLVLRHGRPASGGLLAVFENSCRNLGVTGCDLMVLPGIASPSTVGWWRPRILLPAVCEEMGPSSRLVHVLDHELAHVVRRDYLWDGLSELFCQILFFHPAAWRAKKLMRLERELACDCAVIESRPDHRADYADSLAYFVRLRMLEEKSGVGLDFAASPSSLGRRVRFILAGPPRLPWWNRASRAAVGVATLTAFAVAAPAVTVFLGFARPAPIAAFARSEAAAPHAAPHKIRASVAGTNSVQPISRIQAVNRMGETTVSSLTTGSDAGGYQERSRSNRPWHEMDSSVNHPTVSSVVRDAITIIRPPTDHDRDRDRNPRLSH